MSIFDWSSTASSNTTCSGINCNTGMSPANTDNLIRALMAEIRASFHAALQNFLGGIAALPIANGGTGASTASAALTALGGLEDDYRDMIRTTDKSSSFTLANSERAYGIALTGTTGTITIDPGSTTAINIGAVYMGLNVASGSWTVSPGPGVTLYKNGATSSSSATLAPGSEFTIKKWAADLWTINGVGVS